MVSNVKIGLGVGFAAFGVYLYTMYHLKQQAPGDLSQMVSLQVSEQIATTPRTVKTARLSAWQVRCHTLLPFRALTNET